MQDARAPGLDPGDLILEKGHIGASGEGMAQDHRGNRRVGGALKPGARLLHAVLAVALVGLLAAANPSVAAAADAGNADDSFMAKFMRTIGLKAPPDQGPPDIKYSERSPLVVPPTRDLPPPVADPLPGADWPKDAASQPHRHIRSKPSPAPASAANAAPAGGNAPAAQPGQTTQAGPAGALPPAPNPPVHARSIWNPKTWFNREEYATFTGEPARDELTDPPAGYRTPSPDQPYGVGPERKKAGENQPQTPTVTPQEIPRR